MWWWVKRMFCESVFAFVGSTFCIFELPTLPLALHIYIILVVHALPWHTSALTKLLKLSGSWLGNNVSSTFTNSWFCGTSVVPRFKFSTEIEAGAPLGAPLLIALQPFSCKTRTSITFTSTNRKSKEIEMGGFPKSGLLVPGVCESSRRCYINLVVRNKFLFCFHRRWSRMHKVINVSPHHWLKNMAITEPWSRYRQSEWSETPPRPVPQAAHDNMGPRRTWYQFLNQPTEAPAQLQLSKLLLP